MEKWEMGSMKQCSISPWETRSEKQLSANRKCSGSECGSDQEAIEKRIKCILEEIVTLLEKYCGMARNWNENNRFKMILIGSI